MANPSKIAYVSNTSAPPFDNDLSTDISYTSAAHNYTPALYAKKVLYDFYAGTIFKEITNTEYEGQFKSMGDQIIIRQAPAITSRAYTKGATLTYETPAKDSITMVIDQAQYQAVQVDDIDKVASDVGLMEMYVQDGRKRMEIQIDTNVLLAMSAGSHASNKGTTAGVISGEINLGTDTTTAYIGIDRTNALDKIIEIGQCLDEQNVTDEKWIVLPSWYATRLKLSDLKAVDVSGDSSSILRTGLIGQINGTKVYVNNNLPNTTTTSNSNYAILGGTKMATAFAMQLSKVETLRVPTSFGE
jgi:hypothetical protein